MQSAPSKKQLQQKMNKQMLANNKTVFFTLAKKQRSVVGSLFRKDIILIFCPEDNQLFYVHQGHKLPFGSEANIQKDQIKDRAQVTRSIIQNPPGSSTLVIKYPKKEKNGSQSTQEWKVDMASKGVAQQWADKLNTYKKEKQQQNVQPNNSGIRGNNSNIYQPNNGSGIKNNGSQLYPPPPNPPNRQVNNNPKEAQDIQFLMTDSRVLLNKQNEDVLKYYINPPSNKLIEGTTIKNPSNTNTNVNPSPLQPQPNNNINNSNLNNSLPYQTIIKMNDMSNKPRPPKTENQSRLQIAYETTSRLISPADSRIKPQNQSSLSNDWNYRFIKDPTRQTVIEFEKAAVKAFESVFLQSKSSQDQLVVTQVSGLVVSIAQNFTESSKKLKKQYRNYHYILDSCKIDTVLNVPMSCLIQFLGFVGLVKQKIPRQAQTIKNKRDVQNIIADIQQKTKISNSILFANRCNLYDLTKIYGSYGDLPRIYVDNLQQYMPQLISKQRKQSRQRQFENAFFVRPQLLHDFGNRILPGGTLQDPRNSKTKQQFAVAIQNEIKDVAQCLSNQQFYVTSINDLKEFLHSRGLNMKFLFRVYQQTKNKFVKKYLLTCLVAKILKDQIISGYSQVIINTKISPQQYLQQQISLFIEGRNAATNEYWKKISIQFRNLHGIALNSHELIGGFLLSCLMTLIYADYDVQRLDKQKVIFKDQQIIGRGFVMKMKPKIKSYFRFSDKIVQTIQQCKYSQKNQATFKQLVQFMNLQNKQVPSSYNVNLGKQYILGYLSDFVTANGPDSLPCSKQIYSLVNVEPPNAPSIKITLNFINQHLKLFKNSNSKQQQLRLQDLIRVSIDNINYWLQVEHPIICDFYQKAATFEQICGDTEESLKILEKAIYIVEKTEAKNTKKIGMRRYVAGCQYLKAGRKKEAIQNLQKAKSHMQRTEGLQNQYALVLLKLSSLYLNNGDTDACIKFGKQALKNAQKGKMADSYTIKICEILCRSFQIKGEKQQLRKLSIMCAKDYNRSQQRYTFGQMIKICLTGTIAKLNLQRSKSLLLLATKLKQQGQVKDQSQSMAGLMQKAKSIVVMQNFMTKSDNIDKFLSQYTSKKQLSPESSQYITVLSLVTGCVGLDFIDGLHAQKEYE